MALLFSCWVGSSSLWTHGLQHARLPCPLLSPEVRSYTCPLTQWCHPTIWSSVTSFSSCPQSFPASFYRQSPCSQSYGFSSHHVWMWELDHKEGWALKNWCFWTGVLERTLESLLDSKVIKLVNPKGNQLWIFIGRTDAEVPILWPPVSKSQLIDVGWGTLIFLHSHPFAIHILIV